MARSRGNCALCDKGITKQTRSIKLRHKITRVNVLNGSVTVIAPIGDKVHWACYNRKYNAGYISASGKGRSGTHPIFGMIGTKFKQSEKQV